MAVTYTRAHSFTTEKSKVGIFIQFLAKLKYAVFGNGSNTTEQARKMPSKFFHTRYLLLIRWYLKAIKNPRIRKQFKQAFKSILTDPTLSKEIREGKVFLGVYKIAEYLRKSGAKEIADELLKSLIAITNNNDGYLVVAYLRKSGEQVAADALLAKLNMLSRINNEFAYASTNATATSASELAYSIANIVQAFNAQRMTWTEESAQVHHDVLPRQGIGRRRRPITLPLSAQQGKYFTPSFAKHCDGLAGFADSIIARGKQPTTTIAKQGKSGFITNTDDLKIA